MDIIDRLYAQYELTHCVTTDSRAITPGCIFFAFKGSQFDGNAYALQALEQGASLCVVSDPNYATDDRCILVSDVLATLQQLAIRHREHLDIPIVGITGTNGKTTTKELTHAVLSRRYRTYATQGNFNNHLGVPLTLLSIPRDTEIAIVEMGANHPGEIAQLCAIAQPTLGLITNVGKAHLEGFGSFEGVIETKTELYRHIATMHGTLFVNADNDILMDRAERLATLPEMPSLIPAYAPGTPVIEPTEYQAQLSLFTYGRGDEADVKAHYLGSEPYMKFYFERGDDVYTVQSQLIGGYNFDNALAALCVGTFFDVEPFDIKEALENYVPTNNRSQYKQTEKNSLLLDCYNANPSSMKVALDNFANMKADNKIAMLGSMRELGAESEKEHRKLLDQLLASDLKEIYLVGQEFQIAEKATDARIHWFPEVGEVVKRLENEPIEHATILLKGSNSTQMWKLVPIL